MVMLVFTLWVSLVLHCCSVVVGESTVTAYDDPVPMSTILPPFIGNITISPSTKVKYRLELETSGPAVLDSTITFTAKLWVMPDFDLPKGKFHYLWLNSADKGQDRTVAGHVAELKKTFDGKIISHGSFLMTVIVQPRHQEETILIFGSIQFKLTEHLNGNLTVNQDLAYQRRDNIFAVDKDVHFHVNLTDRFRKPDSPKYTFFWYNGTELIHSSKHSQYEQNFSRSSVLNLQAVATANFNDKEQFTKNAKDDMIKFGTFQKHMVFKESLSDCNMTRIDSAPSDQSLKLGDSVILNITCNGSSPLAVCWNVTELNVTLNNTCKPPSVFQNKTHYEVAVPIGQTGWNTLHLAVYNDISFQLMSQNYYVYDADTVNIPALVFPTVFIIIGIVIAVVGGAYIVRLRRKHHVEVADFDFDPNISVRGTSFLSPVAAAVKQLYSRVRDNRRQRANSQLFQQGTDRSHGYYESL